MSTRLRERGPGAEKLTYLLKLTRSGAGNWGSHRFLTQGSQTPSNVTNYPLQKLQIKNVNEQVSHVLEAYMIIFIWTTHQEIRTDEIKN